VSAGVSYESSFGSGYGMASWLTLLAEYGSRLRDSEISSREFYAETGTRAHRRAGRADQRAEPLT